MFYCDDDTSILFIVFSYFNAIGPDCSNNKVSSLLYQRLKSSTPFVCF